MPWGCLQILDLLPTPRSRQEVKERNEALHRVVLRLREDKKKAEEEADSQEKQKFARQEEVRILRRQNEDWRLL